MTSLDKILFNVDTEDEYIKQLMGLVVGATKLSNKLPKGLDFNYLNSITAYREKNKQASEESKGLLLSLLNFARSGSLPPVQLPADISDSFFYEQISETIDLLLDEAANSAQRNLSETGEQLLSMTKQSIYLNKERVMQENVKDLPKPQVGPIDNDRNTPFRPKFITKYHKREDYQFIERALPLNDGTEGGCNSYFPHPYENELLELKFPDWLTEKPTESENVPFPDPNRPFQLISTTAELNNMINELTHERFIAVDLEHHSYRSFQGFTCLIQMSTLDKDYIVDPLSLQSECEKLGIIFADPKILKVFHGCEQDILWLQKDFGVYIVNAFDTFLAAKELQFPALSLAHLAKFYCNVELDKKHQLSDWRERPLTNEMIQYAKLDTHYLLFIYYSITMDLWSQIGVEGIEKVLFLTRKLCLQRYEKPPFDAAGYKRLFNNSAKSKFIPKFEELSALQETAISMLWNWRDKQARVEDESYEYIMPNAELLRLGVKIPQSIEQIDACGPLSTYVQSHKLALWKLFLDTTTIDASKYLNQQQEQMQRLDNHRQQFVQHEKQRFDSLFTAIPKIPDKYMERGIKDSNYSFDPSRTEEYFKSSNLTVDEVFKGANWEACSRVDLNEGSSGRLSSLNFDSGVPVSKSDEVHTKISKSLEDLTMIIQSDREFEAMLDKLVKEKHQKHVILETAMLADQRDYSGAPSSEALLDLPKSYEEIYRLSGKNRKKNKDKKRNRETDSSIETDTFLSERDLMDPPTVETVDEIVSSRDNREVDEDFDVNEYFSMDQGKAEIDISVDATLKFAQQIGWLKSEQEFHEIRKDHERVLAEQQSIEDSNEEGKRAGVSSLSHHDLHSSARVAANGNQDKKIARSQGSNNNHGIYSNAHGHNSSAANYKYVKAPTNSVQGTKSNQFDYSKVSSLTIGALSANGASAQSINTSVLKGSLNRGGSGGKVAHNSTNRAKANPYFTHNKK